MFTNYVKYDILIIGGVNMKEKLKNLQLRLTELAEYLGISRPTLYKYLEAYEEKKYKQVEMQTLAVFRFINKTSTISKLQVFNYIVQLQKERAGVSSNVTHQIEKIIVQDGREEELIALLKLFDLPNSKSIIQSVITKHIRGNMDDSTHTENKEL